MCVCMHVGQRVCVPCTSSAEGPANPSDKLPTASPHPPRSRPFGSLLLAWLAALLQDNPAPPPYNSPPHPTHTKQTNSNSQHSLQPPPPSRGRSIWLFAFHLTRASQEPHFLKKTQYSSLSLSLLGQLILTVCKCVCVCVNACVCVCMCIYVHMYVYTDVRLHVHTLVNALVLV